MINIQNENKRCKGDERGDLTQFYSANAFYQFEIVLMSLECFLETPMTKKWFTESVEETLTQFNVSTEQGLTSEEVEQRQAEHGKNELQEQ